MCADGQSEVLQAAKAAHQHAEMAASVAGTLAELVCQLPSGEAVGQLLYPVLGRAVLRAAPASVRQDDIHRRC